MTFHTFYPKTWEQGYYLHYEGEVTWRQIVREITKAKPKEKAKCAAIVLNRFKQVETRYETTVRNQYQLLDYTTGYYGLDVDNCGKLTDLVKQTIFAIPEILIAWVSPSGNGIKAIGYNAKLKGLDPKKFKSTYNIHTIHLRTLSGMRINFDPAMNRCHQPIFINSDPNALVR